MFILNGGDWIWSSEQLYFSPRTVTVFGEISPFTTTKIKIYDASFLGAFIKRHYLVNNWMCNGAY